MRRAEILTLHKSQIDLSRDVIVLHAEQTKSGKTRGIPINSQIRPVLEKLCEKVKATGYLFENPKTGKPIADIKNAWRSALRDSGISNIRFHDVRHTFGTR